MQVILGVGGGIAAYKAVSLLRLLTESGHSVTVIPTRSALRFVGAATWEALSGKPVSASVFDHVDQVNHVRLGHEADLLVVAPATADLLAKAAGGHADDLLTTTLLMARGPVVFAPAMHSEMWAHPATSANVAILRSRGAVVIEPAEGRLTGTDSGPGRLPEPEQIYAAALATVGPAPLRGRRVLVTAGGTHEPLDPVRYLGNRSSGKQGVALARAARAAGAEVTLIAAHVEVPLPEGMDIVRVGSSLELEAAVGVAAPNADIVLMAAAVADFRPARTAQHKIKKRDDGTDPVISLMRTPDILAGLVRCKNAGQLIVGFAAETGDNRGSVLEYARAKLERKGCDLLVVNEVGAGKVFGEDRNQVMILRRNNGAVDPEQITGSKDTVAAAIITVVTELLLESSQTNAAQ